MFCLHTILNYKNHSNILRKLFLYILNSRNRQNFFFNVLFICILEKSDLWDLREFFKIFAGFWRYKKKCAALCGISISKQNFLLNGYDKKKYFHKCNIEFSIDNLKWTINLSYLHEEFTRKKLATIASYSTK